MKKRIAIIIILLILVVGALFGINRFRLYNGWKPFGRMKANDVYYACVHDMKDKKVVYFEQDELNEFVALMNDMKVQPTFRDPEEFELEGYTLAEAIVFERKAQKGKMLRLEVSEMKKDGKQMYIVWLNDDVYEIEENVYKRIDTFMKRAIKG